MNGRKKLLCVFFLTLFLFSYFSINVFAVTVYPDSKLAAMFLSRKVYDSGKVAISSSSQASSAVSSQPPQSDIISLPGVDSVNENDPFSSTVGGSANSRMTLMGIISWVCIILGVLVVLVVVLSNRRPPRGPGRRRYHKPKRSRKKHLLNDKYYHNLNRY